MNAEVKTFLSENSFPSLAFQHLTGSTWFQKLFDRTVHGLSSGMQNELISIRIQAMDDD